MLNNAPCGTPHDGTPAAGSAVATTAPIADTPRVDWTAVMVETMTALVTGGDSETAALRAAVAGVASHVGDADTLVDSVRLATAAVRWRTAQRDLSYDGPVSYRQTLDYIQYLLREAPHVCRHSVGDGQYRVHGDAACSASCDTKWASTRRPDVAAAVCDDCFTSYPAALGACDRCN